MASVVVCGGSVIGLSVAMMLARDGVEVTVLEGDPAGAPTTADEAWERWERKGVAQFRQPHNLFPRFRTIAEAELPGLTERLAAAGCVRVNYADTPPPALAGAEPRSDDERFTFLNGRRPVVESAIAAMAEQQPRLVVRRGVRATALLTGPSAIPGVPHVTGVRASTGQELRADLVVDAMGRRTIAPDLLAGIGARPAHREAEDSGFVYYTRFYRGPDRPRRRAPGLTPMGSVSILTLDGDNDTWSVTVFGQSRDTPLKALRSGEVFERFVRAFPAHAHWLAGRPIGAVVAMAGVVDCYRRYVVDGTPVVTGFAAVGDAWACTNPSAGRGLSIGMIHAQLLRGVAGAHLAEPAVLAQAWDEVTERDAAPFYRNQIAADRARFAEMDALRRGEPPPPPDPRATRFVAAAMRDPELFRVLIEVISCLALPEEALSRPAVAARIEAVGDVEPLQIPGPDRARQLELLGA